MHPAGSYYTNNSRYTVHKILKILYRVADKSLARPDWKKQLKSHNFSSDAEVIAAAETWSDGRTSDFFFFLSGLQKLEFGRCSFFLPGRAKDL